MPRPPVEKEFMYGFPLFTNQNNTLKICDKEKLIISDIWSFWYYAIKKKSQNKSQENFLNSLLDQAKFFFSAAETSPTKSQPLLYYYSFLNFAKLLININNYVGQAKKYRHGVSDGPSTANFGSTDIHICAIHQTSINVSAELYKTLDSRLINSPFSIRVVDLLRNCVGVHRTFCEIYNQKEDLFKISEMKLYKKGLRFEIEAQLQCRQTDMAALQACGYNVRLSGKNVIWNEFITLPNHNITRKTYYDFSSFLRDKGIWYFIGNNGYTLYLSANTAHRYPQEFVIYNVMFYLGSITRYRPYLFDEIFSAKEQWLMSEFLKTQPKQFLYLSSAKLLSQDVIKAYADF